MKRFILSLFSFFFFFVPSVNAAVPAVELTQTEHIQTFESEIVINQDTSISITENILYFTPEEKHGIYRYIPEKYRREGQIFTNPVSQVRVTDSNGVSMPFEVYREDGNAVIKIGNPDETFSGFQKYVVSYLVADAVMKQKGFGELYWDITGEGWSFPILSAEAEVKTEFAGIQDVVCFTGVVGGNEAMCETTFEHTKTIITTDKQIDYGDNFTVAVKLEPNNNLIYPSVVVTWWRWLVNNLAYFLLPLPAFIMFWYWYKKGRDYRFVSSNVFDQDQKQPQGMKPVFEPVNIPMVYEPLKDLTPGEAGALLDERVDNQDVISEIIDLCRKKFMKIEKIEKKGFLRFGHDYLFTKLKEPEKLPVQQQYLMENIFDSKKEIKLEELKGKFYTHMGKVKEMMYDNLTKHKYFTSKPINAIGKGIALAIFLDVLVFVGSIESIAFLETGWPVLIMMISFGISIIFALKMIQKTAVGTNLSLQAKGLRETIRLGKWREEIKEKHLFIEEVLPFAISLGVIGKLAKDMSDLNITPPNYFNGGFVNNPAAWSGFVNDFSKTVSSGLSYNPNSSSSGGSGFSGGSSGGGGGGGGGGSW